MGKRRGGGGGGSIRGGVSKARKTTEQMTERLDAELDAVLAAQQARQEQAAAAAQKRRLPKVKSAAAEASPWPSAAALVAHGESLFVALGLGGETDAGHR